MIHVRSIPLVLALALTSSLASAVVRPDLEVYDRAAIERSGAYTLAEFLRGLAALPFGVSRPGYESIPLARADFPGLGAARTAILIDGRPLPESATGNGGANLAAIPLALVERIEVRRSAELSNQDTRAGGGSINLVLRRVEGGAVALGYAAPQDAAGDQSRAAGFYGIRGERGSVHLGITSERTDALPQGERPPAVSYSTFSNNFVTAQGSAIGGYSPGSLLRHPVNGAVVPGGCNGAGFSSSGSGPSTVCRYDYTLLATAEPELRSDALSARADLEVSAELRAYLDFLHGRARTSGRDAPRLNTLLNSLLIPINSPYHPANRFPGQGYDPTRPLFLRHRFVASGALYDGGDERTQRIELGLEGRRGAIDWSLALVHAQSRAEDRDEGVLSGALAAAAIADGRYDIYDPYANAPELVDSFLIDASRDARVQERGIDATASAGFGAFAGGEGAWRVAAQYREESLKVADTRVGVDFLLPRLGGARQHAALATDLRIPFHPAASTGLGLRHDQYDSVGGDTSASIDLRVEAGGGWWLQADALQSYVAPRLQEDLLQTGAASYYVLYSTRLAPHCTPTQQFVVEPCALYVREHVIDNPALGSERHRRWRLGLGWAHGEDLRLSLTWFDHALSDRVQKITGLPMVQCLVGLRSQCPRGISVLPLGLTVPDPRLGLGVTLEPTATIEETLIQSGYVNLGGIELRGIELQAAAGHDLGSAGRIDGRLDAVYLDQRDHTGDVDGFLPLPERALGATGLPRVRARLDLVWTRGDLALGWLVRHVGATQSLEDGGLSSWTAHDVQLRWQAPWQATVAVGVRNLFDRDPVVDPADPTGDGYALALYDGGGRTPYLQYHQRW
ncbi:MAG: TonB-dependent receptor [Lysobacterales bacterium]